jgi:hypothetical protein
LGQEEGTAFLNMVERGLLSLASTPGPLRLEFFAPVQALLDTPLVPGLRARRDKLLAQCRCVMELHELGKTGRLHIDRHYSGTSFEEQSVYSLAQFGPDEPAAAPKPGRSRK